MNLILGTLSELKAHLLAAAVRDGTDFDAAIEHLGRGVAALFESRCNRKFARVEDDTFEFSATVSHFVLPRYPVEEISAIALSESLAEGWVDQGEVSDVIENYSPASGVVFLSSQVSGLRSARLRVTFTGGFWFEDDEAPAAQPAGSTTRPADLFFAWLAQCEAIWAQRDKLGLALASKAQTDVAIARAELVPLVEQTLAAYVRFTL